MMSQLCNLNSTLSKKLSQFDSLEDLTIVPKNTLIDESQIDSMTHFWDSESI